ncbi:MAG: adenylosuccinate synthetase [Egibacteraceae bacterium]
MSYSLSVIILSGPIGSGKTTLAEELTRRYDAAHISTSGLILMSAGGRLTRRELQKLSLDASFQGGQWLANALTQVVRSAPSQRVIVVDAVRTFEQVQALRRTAAGAWHILHAHLFADDRQLADRYHARARLEDSGVTWSQAMKAPGEATIQALEVEADLVIDTTWVTPADVAVRVGSRISFARSHRTPCVDVLVGGQWGSEGKGNLAFSLAPEYDLLVRVGAPNAGHKVHGYDGIIYTHRQLPSGTRAATAPLLLGAGAVLDVSVLLREIADCQVSPERLTIDPNALIIETDDVASEAAVKQSIGSTGTGGGAAVARRIMQRGVPGAVRTAKDVPELSPYVRDSAELLEQAYARGASILIEGTQGTSLSILHGSFPHVTSRDTTVGTLLSEVGVPPQRLRRVVVAFRAYPIRVGGPSGPMGREITWETVAQRAGLRLEELRAAELGSVSQKERRVAEFSWVQLETSARLNGATDIALTFADHIDARNRQARRLEQLTDYTIHFIQEVEWVTGSPVSLISTNFDGRGLIDRRQW